VELRIIIQIFIILHSHFEPIGNVLFNLTTQRCPTGCLHHTRIVIGLSYLSQVVTNRSIFQLNSVYFVYSNIINYEFASSGFTICTHATSLTFDLTSDQTLTLEKRRWLQMFSLFPNNSSKSSTLTSLFSQKKHLFLFFSCIFA